MPKKLTDCVQHVKDQGKSEDSAWAICVDSTGLSPHHKKKDVKKAKLNPKNPNEVEVRYHQDRQPEMCDQCKKKQAQSGSPLCFQCNLNKSWKEYNKSRPVKKMKEVKKSMCQRCGNEGSEPESGFCKHCNDLLASNGGNDPANETHDYNYNVKKAWKEYTKSVKTDDEIESERAIAGGGRAGWEAREKKRKYQNPKNDEDDMEKSEKTGIPEIDSPIHREPEALPNMRTRPRRATEDWERASLEEERHQDELNEMMSANESDYDEAAAYAHEGDDLYYEGFYKKAVEMAHKLSPEEFEQFIYANVREPEKRAWYLNNIRPLTPEGKKDVEDSMSAYEEQMRKSWGEYLEKGEWKPYKEWIKDKEEARKAPKKAKVGKKDKPWKDKK